MTIAQCIAAWSGFVGAPGYTIIHMQSTAASNAPFGTFWGAIAAYLPTGVTVTVPNNGRFIDEATGKMTGVWSSGTQVATTGTGGTTFTAAQGALVRWDTNAFVRGRRVKGHMFIVPLASSGLGSGGVLSSGTTAAIAGAATTMIQNYTGNLVVWTRPIYEKDANGHPTDVLKVPGTVSAVTTATCPTKVAIRRSRRDA